MTTERRFAPVALVTGCSSGIGLESAVALAEAGHRVVATLRDPSRARPLRSRAAAAGVEIDVRPLDVTDDGEAAACVAAVLADHGSIDLLLNNAGSGYLGSLEQFSLGDLDEVMAVNFVGVARMTKLVLPHQRARRSGRIVTVTSVGGIVGQPFNDAYCAAKFAVEGLVESLAPVVAAFGVHVSLVEPGPVATEFISNAMPSVAARLGTPGDPYRALFDRYVANVTSRHSAAQGAVAVAQVVVRAATEPEPRLRYQTSAAAAEFVGMKLADLDGSAVLSATGAWLS